MDARVIFPSVVYERRIIKSRVIKDNRKQRGILMGDSNPTQMGLSDPGSSCHDRPLNS